MYMQLVDCAYFAKQRKQNAAKRKLLLSCTCIELHKLVK